MVCVLVATGCGRILGADEYRVDATDAGTVYTTEHGAFRFATECGECLDARCAAELDACAADATCTSYIGCDGACMPGDLECASACAGRHTRMLRGVEPFALLGCRIEHCEKVCGKACVGTCFGNLECDECAKANCDTLPDAVTDPASREVYACLQGAVSPGCFPDGLPEPLGDRASCVLGRCNPSCLFGVRPAAPDTRCFGRMPRVAQSGGTADAVFRVFVHDPEVGPIEGASVRGCRLGPGVCGAADVTGEDGMAEVVAKPLGWFFDYLEVEDTLEPARFDPRIHVETPPVVHNGALISADVVSVGALDGYYAVTGHEWDRTRLGTVGMTVVGCGGLAGPGFRFESSLGGIPFYFVAGQNVPDVDLVETTANAQGGFGNSETGTGEFRALYGDTLVATVLAPVRAGSVTFVNFAPSWIEH